MYGCLQGKLVQQQFNSICSYDKRLCGPKYTTYNTSIHYYDMKHLF